jgi:hypothetical protein
MRKIIQISTRPLTDDLDLDNTQVYALCDDGSLWTMEDSTISQLSSKEWRQLPPIPQPPSQPEQ